jgi:hypothetical protein
LNNLLTVCIKCHKNIEPNWQPKTRETLPRFTTKLFKAQSKSSSIRSTIPSGIAAHLKLGEGDWIDWSLEIVKNELVAVVRKIEEPVQEEEEAAKK